jgi:DNA-binding XRE family transcriptional regulator
MTRARKTEPRPRPPASEPVEKERPAPRCPACGNTVSSAGVSSREDLTALCLRCVLARPGASYAERLKALRLFAGLTRQELAQRAGITARRALFLERGEVRPTPYFQDRLAFALGMEIVSVLRRTT